MPSHVTSHQTNKSLKTSDSITLTSLALKSAGFIYCKKSETMPKPKFKVEKLCHVIYRSCATILIRNPS